MLYKSTDNKYSVFDLYFCNDIENTIIDDDLDRFITLTTQPGFDTNCKMYFGNHSAMEIEERKAGMFDRYSYMQFIAFCGSVKCFKQAIMAGGYDINDIVIRK